MSDLIDKVKEDKDDKEDKQTTKDNESLILYFDILGYKQKFDEDDFDQAEFLRTIEGCVESAKLKAERYSINNSNIKMTMKVFSDNFIFVCDGGTDTEQLIYMWFMFSDLQTELLMNYYLLVRGAMVRGNIVINDDFVFGKGLIHAIELEGKAEYPRIILDDSVFNNKSPLATYTSYVYKDFDGKNILHHEAVMKPDIINRHELYRIRDNITELLEKHGKYKDSLADKQVVETEKTVRKYLYVVESFNDFCNHANKLESSMKKNIKFEPISYDLVLNKKYMRAEIANIK